jgi:hypothetical protein
MRRFLAPAAVIVTAAATLAGTAAADAIYHTQRFLLQGVAGAPGGGTVVNIHPNGPQVFAHEIYTLRHAAPGTYAVVLNAFPTSTNCTGTKLAIPTATLETNGSGNGLADVKFTPEDAAGLRNMTFSISWTVTGPATYVTACSVVQTD